MDEEEQKRQAASAAFAQAEGMDRMAQPHGRKIAPYENPDDAISNIRARGAANDRSELGASVAEGQDWLAQNQLDRNWGAGGNSGVNAAATQIMGQPENWPTIPGASEAFAQLDQASAQNPTQFDQASVANLEPAQQQMVRENFDANLEAATRAVEEYAQGDDAFAKQAQRLLERAERAKEMPKALPPLNRDDNQKQLDREAAVSRRMAEYDVFSSPTATMTLFTPDTSRTNTWDRIMRDKSGKEVFDYFM